MSYYDDVVESEAFDPYTDDPLLFEFKAPKRKSEIDPYRDEEHHLGPKKVKVDHHWRDEKPLPKSKFPSRKEKTDIELEEQRSKEHPPIECGFMLSAVPLHIHHKRRCFRLPGVWALPSRNEESPPNQSFTQKSKPTRVKPLCDSIQTVCSDEEFIPGLDFL
ncbi:uncharacterized protein C8Q71DRAFT_722881 [Rhodofomes roseus]|uniref:Uncharacterized protein n=1 Tax=Rhodofomes roseus TaxID=34475 RepID=A0ABQ8KL68_9APHY|nr:uncharacterized protein C8Q71DRAFT_722881 [Rhodofomes roseus]KAH9838801.1 hypothetical protein C8Q71DRAFT_722881 [Rhodofomes roseus]